MDIELSDKLFKGKNLKAWVVGNDSRQVFLAELLEKTGVCVYTDEPDEFVDFAVFPIPITKEIDAFYRLLDKKLCATVFGGRIDDEVKNAAEGVAIVYDYTKDDDFAELNAIPSAEGAIRLLMASKQKTLSECSVLLIGYGRIAKHIHRLLNAFGSRVFVAARSHSARKIAKQMGATVGELNMLGEFIKEADMVVNSVPSPIITQKELKNAKKDVYLQDLASSPGGIPKEEAAICGLTVDWALALPSRFTPQTAAFYVATVVDKILGGVLCKENL